MSKRVLYNITSASLQATNISGGTINATTFTGGNLSLSGDLKVAGTLTTVNITSTNLVNTNVSAGVVVASTLLSATGNSNTIGSIFTTGGNIGIGITSPSNTLDVSGTIRASTSLTTGAVYSTNIISTNISAGSVRFNNDGSGLIWGNNFSKIYDDAHLHIYTDDNMFFHTTNTTGTAMYIGATNGNVGIGTTSPNSKLHVLGSTSNLGGTIAEFKSSGNAERLQIIDETLSSSLPGGILNATGSFGIGVYARSGPVRFFTTAGNLERMRITETGNVGIGTSSPSRLLSLSGPHSNGVNGPHIWINTSDSPVNPVFQQLNWSADNVSLNFDMYYDGSFFKNSNSSTAWQIYKLGNQMKFTYQNGTAGSSNGQLNAMVLGSTGNIGIGTSAPANTLDVSGTARITTSITTGAVFSTNITSTNVVATNISGGTISATTFTGGNLSLSGDLKVAGTLTTVNITSTNLVNTNVSAGVVVASTLLSATGNSNTVGAIITTGGNVGIGTTAPAYTLDVTGSVRLNSTGLQNFVIGSTSGTVNHSMYLVSSHGNLQIGIAAAAASFNNSSIAGDVVIRSSKNLMLQSGELTPNLYIATSGNIGIGCTAPTHLFSVGIAPNGTTKGSISINTNDESRYHLFNYAGVAEWLFGQKSTSRSDFTFSKLVAGTETDYLTISTGGNVGIGTTAPGGILHLNNVALFTSTGNLTCTGDIISFGSLSDIRLKKDVESIDIEKAIDVVSRLRGVTFKWREDVFNENKRNTNDIGFIAQEIEKIIPEAVSEYTEITSKEVYKNIKHERIIPYLLVTIQYLLDKINK